MRGICQGCPPSYHEFPYPCPKPVGELAMRLPGDAKNLRITQTLDIENAEVTILCEWENGLALSVVCHVANPENILCLEWKLTGWTPRSRYGGEFAGVGPSQPVWFRLYRWADPTIESFGNEYFSRHRHPGLRATAGPTATPLPPPSLRCDGGAWGIINALTTRGGCSAITHPSVLLTLQAWGAHAHPFLAALLQRTELLRSTLVNASLETNKTGECYGS